MSQKAISIQTEKTSQISTNSGILIGDLVNLPIGILVCEAIQSTIQDTPTLVVTEWNPYSSILLDFDPQLTTPFLLDTHAYLHSVHQTISEVLKTGIPNITESYVAESGNWVEQSICRIKGKCLIYLKTNTLSTLDTRVAERLPLDTALADISEHILHIQTNKLDDYLVEALRLIGTCCQADRVYVFSYAKQEEAVTCTHKWYADGIAPLQIENQPFPVRQLSWWHQQLIFQQPFSLNNLHESISGSLSQQVLVVPMIFNQTLVGFLGIETTQQPRIWTKSEVYLLKVFSNLVVTATNRVKREQLLQRTNKRLMGLNRLNQALLNSNLFDEQPDLTALQHLFEMIPCELGIALRMDQSGELAGAESRIRHGKREVWPGIRLPTKEFHYTQFSTGKEVLINKLQPNTPDFPAGFNPYSWGHRSFLGIPLFAHQQYIGLLLFLDKRADFFTQEHVLIGKEVASHLSSLIYQHEVHRQLVLKADALDKSNRLFQAVIDNSLRGLALLKPTYATNEIIDFQYLINNPKSAIITGVSQDAMLEQSLLTLFPHLRMNGVFDKMVSVIRTGESQQFQLLDELPTGAFWGDFSLIRVGTDLLFSVNDITPTKQIEEKLRLTNANLERSVIERTAQIQHLSALQRAILRNAGLAIAATDINGIIQLVNPALEELTGYLADELIGKVTPGALREPNSHHQQIDQLKPDLNNSALAGEEVITTFLKKHGFLRRENTLLTKDGRLIPVLSTVSGLYDDHKNLIGFVDIATDVSNLKAIEQELLLANQRNQIATRAGKLGVWEWNVETGEFELDEHIYSFFNVPSHIRIHSLQDLKHYIHTEDSLYFDQYEAEIVKARKPFTLEFRVVLPVTQAIHWIRVDGIMLSDQAGTCNRMVGVLRDRTAKRKAEYALQQSEKKYRSLVDHLKEVVFQTDASGLWTYLNPAWEEITGYNVKESLGKLFLDYVLPDDQARNQAQFEPLIARQKTYCRHEVRYLHKDGGFRWIEVFAQLTLDEQDQISGTTGTLTDITNRKKAEEALYESEQRFREIAENVDELFWIRDSKDPKFLYMNSAFEQFSGIPLGDLYTNPQSFLSTILEEDRPLLTKAFVHPEPGTEFQFRARHKDGSLRWLNARLFGVQRNDSERTRRIGVATDITMAIEKEQMLAQLLEKERSLNDLKSQFIATASHEFRTPLTAISTSIELLQYYANLETDNPITPILNKHADNISQKVLSLSELIMDTLTISKLAEGKQEVNLELINISELIETLIKLDFCDRPDHREVEIQKKGQAIEVRVDKKLMTHVLTNLLTNAFKFSTGNPILTIYYEEATCRIDVTDNGIGIPEKDIPNLFSKFFRASNANDIKGTGLGLAICQEYLTLQNGAIDIESTEGVGTTFSVRLPIS